MSLDNRFLIYWYTICSLAPVPEAGVEVSDGEIHGEANAGVNSEAKAGVNSEATGEVMNSGAEASEEVFVETLNEVNIEANEEGSGTTRLVDELLEASEEEQRSEHQHATSAGGYTLYTGF